MTMTTWCAVCPECGIPVPVYELDDPRILEHAARSVPDAFLAEFNHRWHELADLTRAAWRDQKHPNPRRRRDGVEFEVQDNTERDALLARWAVLAGRCGGSLRTAPTVFRNGDHEGERLALKEHATTSSSV